ncbi:hypothetical protein GE300_08075 [Rhodobacteraceae bacterium 2CG4]|uniref:Lipoprotein n=1 Tax=Halovulum marinum TaxID=2662447 RepID=A0A6L5Z0H1_9RHOB|nr:hypothetical protein [Halovulum marinum]MSU89572.1 hypothetical protein [Halovulum marinum]
MKPLALPLLLSLGVVAACETPQQQQIAFQSQQERVCHERVSATLPADRRLERDSAGRFVEITVINAQLRDIDVSERFNQCMASVAPADALSDMGTVTFTREEQAIWDSLTDAARRDALIYIRGGGTLREFVAL